MDIRKKKIKGLFVVTVLIILFLCGASVLSFFTPNKIANAILLDNIENGSTNLGEMLLEGYEEDTTGNGKVFDKKIFWELIKQISGIPNPNDSTLDNLTTPKTSDDFRTLNGGTKDVVVQIGGKKWIATYLSTNSKGEPILTLWLANSTTNARWNAQGENSLGKYPNNMYGTSEMRAKTLNNGGGYAAKYNATSLTSITQSESSEWAIYTMDSVKGSLTSFIEVPDNMSWQHNQSAKDSAGQSSNYNNDALDVGGNGTAGDYSTNSTIDKAGYKGWANDRLWLPSVAETGVSGVDGIWKADNTTRANSSYSWLRSVYSDDYVTSYRLDAAGSRFSSGTVTTYRTIRPAFHLNLKTAAERAGSLGVAEPTDVSIEYTGQSLTIADIS
ncbi:MAG: hypothetical protein K2N32_04375, partial [Clostridia bacterium]|nr:hypothetical protein [Clostridia bacterium]